jgi:hypothetical protein
MVFNNSEVVGLLIPATGCDQSVHTDDRQLTGAPLACSVLLVGKDGQTAAPTAQKKRLFWKIPRRKER